MQKELPAKKEDDTSFAIIRRKNPEAKMFLLGVALCLILGASLYLLSREVVSLEARLEHETKGLFSPIGGRVYEIMVEEGDEVEEGAVILRYDPMYLRRQAALTAEYLEFFRQNRHNPGTLRQKFRPIFGEIFDELSNSTKMLRKQEMSALETIEKLSDAEAAILVVKRDKKNENSKGLPKKEFENKEKAIIAEITKAKKAWEKISLQRASVDAEMREITNNLGEPHGILYRYLEERNQAVQDLIRHEYVYAPYDLMIGKLHVDKGEDVPEDGLLCEVSPLSGDHWQVEALFTLESGKDIQISDIYTLILENEDELRAKVLTIQEVNEEFLVTLIVLAPPQWLKASDHVIIRL